MKVKAGNVRILGIDPGSQVTGYGVIDKNGNYLRHVVHGEIKAGKNYPLSLILTDISRQLNSVITETCPHLASLENIFYGKNVRSLIRQAQVRGVVIYTCATQGIPIYEYSPLEVKKAVVGYGRAEKRQVQMMVKAILKLSEVPPADAADALALAICQANYMKDETL
jgi:crossover junction endodeoxyribonuclease RuvC